MINIREKFPDVAFQNPAGARVVSTNLIRERAKSVDRSVRPFIISARIRISDKCLFKKWIKNSVNRVMQQPVANARFVNIPRFGIVDLERLITAVLVSIIGKIAVKQKNIIHQIERKFLHIFPASLPALKFLPRVQ